MNLDNKEGQHVSIIEESGTEKSSIIYLIKRLYKVNNGVILLEKQNIKNYNIKDLRSIISLCL